MDVVGPRIISDRSQPGIMELLDSVETAIVERLAVQEMVRSV